MTRRVLLGMAGWLAVAAAATAGTVAAIGILGDGITGSAAHPLDPDEVQRALAEPRSTATGTPPTTPAGTPPPAGGGAGTRVLAAGGGTVTARCGADGVTLLAWSLDQGYRADDVERGPAATAFLSFKSDDEEYEVTVSCGPDGPVARTRQDDGHHGRGGDDD